MLHANPFFPAVPSINVNLLGSDVGSESIEVPRMRHLRARSNARARRKRQPSGFADLLERISVELRRDLAAEPGLVALARMLARPAAIAAMALGDRLATHLVYGRAAPWIIARSGLRCEHFASRLDRSQSVLATRFRHARLAMTAPALEYRLAADRARGRRGWLRFDGWRAPCARCVRPWLRGAVWRCEQRRSLWTRNAAALVPGFSRERPRRHTLIDQRFTEGLREARGDRPQAFAPMRQREREFVRQRRRSGKYRSATRRNREP
jgi:hypothetical protein